MNKLTLYFIFEIGISGLSPMEPQDQEHQVSDLM